MVHFHHILPSLLSVVHALPASSSIGDVDTFHGDKVLRFTLESSDQLQVISSLVANKSLGLDPWSRLSLTSSFDIRIPQEFASIVEPAISSIPHSVFIEDVQALINRENHHSASMFKLRSTTPAASIFSDYQDAETYVSYLLSQPGAKEFSIGTSYENRPIKGVKFGSGNYSVFFNGGVHAREWISPATTTYVANFLMSDDPRAVSLRSMYTFHVVPVINVDGYAYSRKKSRLWRKNREPNNGNRCVGTDINRNFGFHWSEPGASDDPCADDFYGSGPFSTKEARGMQDYLATLPNLLSYMDLHSYSQLWLYPWGFSCNEGPAPDHADHDAASQLAAKALKAVRGTRYTVEQGCELYVATGCTDENFYTSLFVKYSMTIELPDTGNNGFILPASEIVPVGKETVEALVTFWGYAIKHPKILYQSN